ncbi:baseplate J/gp47 family protein [Paenibacillus thiaminolyticus]|uniref:baseplate J/gp47 family protein n=1 Tax=Paenibacillus thiaminolyticus TaxID=49283 RepID=UPI001164B806|nr:baseplate J/gp47 family protein [Paenibacillus thiaminolyticus]NGP57803.1 baseplate J/gp47 family protein [Paenibacillus thiaminolyticus]
MRELPPFLQEETEEVIRDRMLSRLPMSLDRSEGSFPWDVLEPAAIELIQAADWAKEVLRRAFASTTFGPYLDERCAEHGVTRRPAATARSTDKTIRFTGKPGATVPGGYVVATESTESTPALLYRVLHGITLAENGEGFTDVEALDAGRSGNVPAGAIRHLSEPVPGITAVTNLTALEGGTDEESDDSLRERFLLKVRTPTGSGNKSDYEQWALSIPGVGGVKVIPLWAGPGTVKVVLINEEKTAPVPSVVEAVETFIKNVCPIGSMVTVVGATEVPIHVSVTVTLSSEGSSNEVREMIQDGVRAYLKTLAFADPLVRYTRIANIILDIPPVIDYGALKVNGNETNIEIAQDAVAILGTVTINVS